MRLSLVLLFTGRLLLAQVPEPAYESLNKAYAALREKSYDEAIVNFQRSIELAPGVASIRKDLAYTLLKVGETEAARDQFNEAMRLDPNDFHVALECAFLCYETKEQAKARRIFDRIRKTGDPASRATAEQAFRNIDGPLKAGIDRWLQALAVSPETYGAHHELATLAEQRDELELAAEHYLKAWSLLPSRRSELLDLGRVWKALNKVDEANAALLAASRAGEPRTAEAARELLPARYPYVYEFQRALELDPSNVELRRELAYLLLRMGKQAEAEEEFRNVTSAAPEDMLSAAQLGFLYLAHKDKAAAMPLLDRVLNGPDEELANRVRGALGLPQVLPRRADARPTSVSAEAKLLAERSFKAGYLQDALKYLRMAHENDPVDFEVMLKMGWTLNMLHDDRQAIRWFQMAKKSPDAQIASQAAKAYHNLRPYFARFRTTAWLFPFYSSRWKDIFSYGQIKMEMRIGHLPFRPYLSTRFVGDTKRTTGGALPQYLSESSFIFAVGMATNYWHGLMAWGEAGSAVSYLGAHPGVGHMMPDYRGGLAYGKGFGHPIGAKSPGLFYEATIDGVFISRFNNDLLVYMQNKGGYKPPILDRLGGLEIQFYLNGNVTSDTKRQYWTNFAEFGPGVRFRWAAMPKSLVFSVNLLRGSYAINEGNPRKPNFYDLRTGFWYAITR